MTTVTRCLLSLPILFACTRNAHAYLDPGSGSMVVQLLLAGVAGAMVALKIFWRRVVAFFSGLFSKKSRPE